MTPAQRRAPIRLLAAIALAAGVLEPSAAHAVVPTVTARVYSAVVGFGQSTFVVGRIVPQQPGTVELQEFSGHTWRALVSQRLTDERTYALANLEVPGVHRLRVALLRHPSVVSRTVTVRVTQASALAVANRLDAWGASEIVPQVPVPTRVPGLRGVAQIVSGVGDQTLALMVDGTVRAWGYDGCQGVPGNGSSPQVVPGATAVIMVAQMFCQGVALRADGSVWWWGDTNARSVPGPFREHDDWDDVVAIAGGFWDFHVLRRNGTVESDGFDQHGDFGGDPTPQRPFGPTRAVGVSGVISISTSVDDTVYALLANRTVLAWGNDNNGQLGNGHVGRQSDRAVPVRGLHDVVSLATTDDTGLALLGDGSVRAWGKGEALGDGVGRRSDVPVTVSGLHGVTQIAGGGHAAYAVTRNGAVFSWGVSTVGQLGNGFPPSPQFPLTVLKPSPVLGLRHPLSVRGGDSAAYAMVG